MAEEKDKTIEKDQEIIKPVGRTKDELSERDLERASGGYTVKDGLAKNV